jgi:hypothetical protein
MALDVLGAIATARIVFLNFGQDDGAARAGALNMSIDVIYVYQYTVDYPGDIRPSPRRIAVFAMSARTLVVRRGCR